MADYPTSCGEVGWAAVPRIASLLAAFREQSLPVLYPHVAPKQAYDAGRLAAKVPSIMDVPERGYRFVEEVQPLSGRNSDSQAPPERVLRHRADQLPDRSRGGLADRDRLHHERMRSCLGGRCVRLQLPRHRPHDAVYDRSPTVHAVNLFDMAQKYADVLTTAEVLRTLPEAETSL